MLTTAAIAIREIANNNRGTAAVELALASTAFFMFVFGVVEFGRVLWLQNALDYSVAEAARCASLGCATDIPEYAAARAGAGLPSSAFSYSNAACGKLVTASYPVVLNIPFMSLSVALGSQACFPA